MVTNSQSYPLYCTQVVVWEKCIHDHWRKLKDFSNYINIHWVAISYHCTTTAPAHRPVYSHNNDTSNPNKCQAQEELSVCRKQRSQTTSSFSFPSSLPPLAVSWCPLPLPSASESSTWGSSQPRRTSHPYLRAGRGGREEILTSHYCENISGRFLFRSTVQFCGCQNGVGNHLVLSINMLLRGGWWR